MTNPYLQGNFAPIGSEITVENLPVTGEIPPGLNGQLLRIGPDPVAPDAETYHWFTGTGMVHGLQLRDGRAEWYRSRWVRDDDIVAARGWPPVEGPDCDTQIGAGTANTNIVCLAGQRLALVEAGSLPVVLDENLETVARTNFGGSLPGGFSAHPHVDADTGEAHAAVYSPLWNHIQHVVLAPDGLVTRVVDVPVPGFPMVHDCMITKHYFVMFDLPVVLDWEAVEAGEVLPYRWTPDYGARVGLLPRDGGADSVTWHEVEPCYVFHPANGYEDEQGRVVLDVVRHQRMFATDLLGPNEGAPTLERWVVDPARTKVSETRLDDRGQEFPRIAEHLTGKPYRYLYSVAVSGNLDFEGLVKQDLHSGSREYYDQGPGRSFMEAVFVPDPAGASEDAGWLLSCVYDAAGDRSDVVILRADDFRAGPVATVHLPRRVPYGFHGNWVPAQG
jgi:carotenoid cleavage dioxygenase